MHRLFLVIVCFASSFSLAQDASAVQDALDLLFATSYPVVEEHLAADVRRGLDNFPMESRQAWFGRLLMVGANNGAKSVQRLGTNGIVLRAQLPVDRTLEVELSNETVTGENATVDLMLRVLQDQRVIQIPSIPSRIVLKLHREEGIWKIISLQQTGTIDLTDTSLLVNMRDAIILANEASAVGALRHIDIAEADRLDRSGKYTCTLETLRHEVPAEMKSVQFLPDGAVKGYSIKFHSCTDKTYWIVAEPLRKGIESRRTFCTGNTGIIYVSDKDGDACLTAKEPLR